MLKNLNVIIDKNRKCYYDIHYYLHLSCHVQVIRSYYTLVPYSPQKMKYFFQNLKFKTIPRNDGILKEDDIIRI